MNSIYFNFHKYLISQPVFSASDRGLTLGHGFFETGLIKNGVICALHYHYRRAKASANILGITLPFTLEELNSLIIDLISTNGHTNEYAGFRLMVTHGNGERGILPPKDTSPNFVLTTFPFQPDLHSSLTACIVKTRRNEGSVTSRIKSISYLDNVLAKQEAVSRGFDEAILLNSQHRVADGSISNVFYVTDKNIYTPPITEGALPGVMRAIILENFSTTLSISEKQTTVEELEQAHEIFITNALLGIKSLKQINTTQLSEKTHVAEQLKTLLSQEIKYF